MQAESLGSAAAPRWPLPPLLILQEVRGGSGPPTRRCSGVVENDLQPVYSYEQYEVVHDKPEVGRRISGYPGKMLFVADR